MASACNDVGLVIALSLLLCYGEGQSHVFSPPGASQEAQHGAGGRFSDEGANAQVRCSAESYDLSPLASQPAWTVTQPCKTSSNESTVEEVADCSYYFSLCHPLPELVENDRACDGSAMCVHRQVVNRTSSWSSLGSYDNHNVQALPKYPEFTVVYHVNASTTNECRSLLTFRCNESISWNNRSGDDVQQIPENSFIGVHLFSPCTYIFQFHYDGACHLQISTVASKLSPGSYFIIALYGVVFVYAVVGVAIKAAKGNRGWDLIPNRDVWNSVGAYIASAVLLLTSPCRQSRPKQGAATATDKQPDERSGETKRLLA